MAEASGISREEVAGIARLARIAVIDEELDQLAGQLDTIVEAVSAVQAVDTAVSYTHLTLPTTPYV